MNIGNLFKIAVKALSNNKFRGFLTMLGIIIGVAAVITMLAIGQGSKRSIQAQISEMGSNMIMIHPGGERRGGVRLSADDMESLKLEDLQDIQAQTSFVTYVSPAVNSSGQAIYGAENTPTTVYGVNRDYLEILVAATPLFYLSNLLNYYLRNDGSQHRAGVGSVVGNLSDIALNVLLVLVFDMGTRGAALSTALGQVITIAIYLPGFFRPQHVLRFALPRRGWLGPGVSALRAGLVFLRAALLQHALYAFLIVFACGDSVNLKNYGRILYYGAKRLFQM